MHLSRHSNAVCSHPTSILQQADRFQKNIKSAFQNPSVPTGVVLACNGMTLHKQIHLFLLGLKYSTMNFIKVCMEFLYEWRIWQLISRMNTILLFNEYLRHGCWMAGDLKPHEPMNLITLNIYYSPSLRLKEQLMPIHQKQTINPLRKENIWH